MLQSGLILLTHLNLSVLSGWYKGINNDKHHPYIWTRSDERCSLAQNIAGPVAPFLTARQPWALKPPPQAFLLELLLLESVCFIDAFHNPPDDVIDGGPLLAQQLELAWMPFQNDVDSGIAATDWLPQMRHPCEAAHRILWVGYNTLSSTCQRNF